MIELDAFKTAHGIRTDAKAVRRLIVYVNELEAQNVLLKEENSNLKNVLNGHRSILKSIGNAFDLMKGFMPRS